MGLLKKAEKLFERKPNPQKKGLLSIAEEKQKKRKTGNEPPIAESAKPTEPVSKIEDLEFSEPKPSSVAEESDLENEELEFSELPEVSFPEDEAPVETSSDFSSEANSPELETEDFRSDEPNSSMPEPQDPFEEWVEEAREEARKTPFRSTAEDPAPREKEYLFDDDSKFTTSPIEFHLASKSKLENYKALFEIIKEISTAKDLEEFFKNLVYSTLAMIGIENVYLFSKSKFDDLRYSLQFKEGENKLSKDFFVNDDEFIKILKTSNEVMYLQEFVAKGIPRNLAQELESASIKLISPIYFKEELFGFFLLGPILEGVDYSTDDLEFIQILSEVSGSTLSRNLEFDSMKLENQKLKHELDLSETSVSTVSELLNARNLDHFWDMASEFLRTKILATQFSFYVLDRKSKEKFQIFSSTIAEYPEEPFTKDSNLIGFIGHVIDLHTISDFRQNPEITSIYSNDLLGILKEFTIIPFINMSWLLGFLVIHETQKPLEEDSKKQIISFAKAASPILGNILLLEDRESIFHNPFSPVESRIDFEIEKSKLVNKPFTAVVWKIQNPSRIISVVGNEFFTNYSEDLRKSILGYISENDFFSKVGNGKYVLILRGKDKEESDIVIRKIKSNFSNIEKTVPGFKPTYRIHVLGYPTDTLDKSHILEMIDET